MVLDGMPTHGIYLDHAATTPVSEHVRAAMLPYFGREYGNPSSTHAKGKRALEAAFWARSEISKYLEAKTPDDIIFTSGATEADNIAIKSGALGMRIASGGQKNNIIISAIEHSAVYETAKFMSDVFGFEVTILPVNKYGQVNPDDLKNAIINRPYSDVDTKYGNGLALVSVMLANNEIGTVQPIKELANITHRFGGLFHTDAVQGAVNGFDNIADILSMVDMLSLSGHKICGPKGVGMLYANATARKYLAICPLMHGGHQENGLRSGTLNVAGIVGLATAMQDLTSDNKHVITYIRDRFINLLSKAFGETSDKTFTINSPLVQTCGVESVPSICNVRFDGIQAEAALNMLNQMGVYCSAGSACDAGNTTPSRTLKAIGLTDAQARASIRFSFGKENNVRDLEYAVSKIKDVITILKKNCG